ncbi:hypothetical protein JK386_10210 [Nocardioides sp. zg-536]|uniref:Choice-of-anchor G family protein n=1 Tax=Nocardioides faecalis TaxID=2803858 RepID=A0A938Y9E8_9ACTN|nr:choice-of-anchor P family protein [Nocardioides faecalis]MBM9460275.1 hypothetical protein [Nocardioides faecalis]MBS4751200.1 hypothetical protein [Nocardioides faecalis]QVI59884.1 hypothetical protein KG111_06050 [Nocardioides faecalis]
MKKTRTLASAAGALALVTGVASLALIGGGGAASAAGQPSSAFGIQLTAAGTNAIDATPLVTSNDGAPITDSLVTLPPNPLLTGGVISVEAKNGSARASVADLKVAGGLLEQAPQLQQLFTQLQPVCDGLDLIPLGQVLDQLRDPVTGTLLPAALEQLVAGAGQAGLDLSLVTALDLSEILPETLGDLCDVVAGGALVGATAVAAECTGTTGTTTITDLGILGVDSLLDTNKPNSKVEVPGLLEVTVNRQTTNADGTFTVDALYVNLFGQLELTVGSATCGEVTNRVDNPETPDTPDAPVPTPVETNVPVTG